MNYEMEPQTIRLSSIPHPFPILSKKVSRAYGVAGLYSVL
jgi:hypothetical protein